MASARSQRQCATLTEAAEHDSLRAHTHRLGLSDDGVHSGNGCGEAG
jgi:hypothetical protein